MWLTHWAFQFFQSSVSITLRQTSSHAVSICSVSAVHILQSISCMVNLDFSFIGNLVHCLCPLMGSSMHCTLSNKHSLLFLTVAYKISCLVVSSISSCPVVSSISCSVVSNNGFISDFVFRCCIGYFSQAVMVERIYFCDKPRFCTVRFTQSNLDWQS